jgi:hypothetical protein
MEVKLKQWTLHQTPMLTRVLALTLFIKIVVVFVHPHIVSPMLHCILVAVCVCLAVFFVGVLALIEFVIDPLPIGVTCLMGAIDRVHAHNLPRITRTHIFQCPLGAKAGYAADNPQVEGIDVTPLNVEVLGMNCRSKKVKQFIFSN